MFPVTIVFYIADTRTPLARIALYSIFMFINRSIISNRVTCLPLSYLQR